MTALQSKGSASPEDMAALRDILYDALASVRVSDLAMSKKTVVVDCNTDPKKAIEILVENKIRAAPVVDKNRFIGVLDLRDTVKFALQNYQQMHKEEESPMEKTKDAQAVHYLTSSMQFSTQSLAYLSRMRPFCVVYESDSALHVCKLMAEGCHIVGVVNQEKVLLGIISQGQLFQQVCKVWVDRGVFEDQALQNMPVLADMHDAGIVTAPVKSIRNNVRAYDAFEFMSKYNLSGLAVVDENGRIIHNTSAVDIKLWLVCSDSLESSIEEFLISIRKMSVIERYPITVCSMASKFSLAIRKLQATKYHRMWITDKKQHPIGVMALTDIFRFFTAKMRSENKNTN